MAAPRDRQCTSRSTQLQTCIASLRPRRRAGFSRPRHILPSYPAASLRTCADRQRHVAYASATKPLPPKASQVPSQVQRPMICHNSKNTNVPTSRRPQ
eukprot:357163-Chlamydomonas_euryale.AAC.3